MAKGYEGLIPQQEEDQQSKESEGRTQRDAQGKRMDDEIGNSSRSLESAILHGGENSKIF